MSTRRSALDARSAHITVAVLAILVTHDIYRTKEREHHMTGDGREREELAWRMRQIVGEDNVLIDEPMSEHTTFEIGGPADLLVVPESTEEVRDVIEACRASGLPYFVLGNGSDLLVSDEGYRGVIVALADGFTNVSIDGDEMTCQAGVPLKEASEMACELGLSGLEFACGIPGTEKVGNEYSAALGALCCDPGKGLLLLEDITPEAEAAAEAMIREGR